MTELKTALITAGGSGMGADSARALAADGFKVAVLSSSGKGEALAKELGGVGVTGSNQSNDDLQELVDLAMAEWGRIDVLVNSAGHGPRAPVLDLTDEDWHEGMDVYFLNAVRPPALSRRLCKIRAVARLSKSRHLLRLNRTRFSPLLASCGPGSRPSRNSSRTNTPPRISA